MFSIEILNIYIFKYIYKGRNCSTSHFILFLAEISNGKSEETMNNSPEMQDPSSSPDCTMVGIHLKD
jgi:hypothetical protein